MNLVLSLSDLFFKVGYSSTRVPQAHASTRVYQKARLFQGRGCCDFFRFGAACLCLLSFGSGNRGNNCRAGLLRYSAPLPTVAGRAVGNHQPIEQFTAVGASSQDSLERPGSKFKRDRQPQTFGPLNDPRALFSFPYSFSFSSFFSFLFSLLQFLDFLELDPPAPPTPTLRK